MAGTKVECSETDYDLRELDFFITGTDYDLRELSSADGELSSVISRLNSAIKEVVSAMREVVSAIAGLNSVKWELDSGVADCLSVRLDIVSG